MNMKFRILRRSWTFKILQKIRQNPKYKLPVTIVVKCQFFLIFSKYEETIVYNFSFQECFVYFSGSEIQPSSACISLYRLVIIHLQESPESKLTCVKPNCASLCNIVEEQITKTWFINQTQE